MDDYIQVADQLKKTAENLLQEYKIIEILQKYGTVSLTGSYLYHVMTHPDIDLCLVLKSVTPQTAFEIGQDIVRIPVITTMYFRNEFVLHTSGNPLAMFWCVELYDTKKVTWKIDILMSDQQEVTRVLNYGKELTQGLNETTRQIILNIKSVVSKSPDYRRKVRSVDIYRAVLRDKIISLDEWNLWYQTNLK